MTHILKCWPEYFQAMVDGKKNFDVRHGEDRQYQVGDLVEIYEWDPKEERRTGRLLLRRIQYVMHGPPMLPDASWVLGLSGGGVSSHGSSQA